MLKMEMIKHLVKMYCIKLILENNKLSTKDLLKIIKQNLISFSGKEVFDDDINLVSIKFIKVVILMFKLEISELKSDMFFTADLYVDFK